MSEQPLVIPQFSAAKPAQEEPNEGNRSPIEALSLEQIERLLDDIKLDPSMEKGNANQVATEEEGMPDEYGETREGEGEDEKEGEQREEKEELKAEDVILSRNDVIFCQPGLVPGAIDEVDFSVSLNPRQSDPTQTSSEPQNEEEPSILRIIALCKNQEFDSLDEYVFSVRSSNSFEYYQQIRFKIKRGERADIKIAVKIPQLKKSRPIQGIVEVRLGDLEPIYVPLVAQCIVPEVLCARELYKEDEGVSFIKIPAKKCQQRTPPVPFKNNSPFNLSFEVEAISNQSFEDKPYDIVIQNFVNCQANSQFFVNMQLRENVNFVGVLPARATIRKILLMKIRNSAVVFHFPIEIGIFQGQSLEGN